MIQRIQTVYLAVVALLGSTMLFIELVSISAGSTPISLTGLNISWLNEGEYTSHNQLPSTLLIIISTLLAITAIGLFKNRKLQMKLTQLIGLFNMGLLIWLFYETDSLSKIHAIEGVNATVNYSVGIIFPLINIVLLFLAKKAIKKDDDLVRSVDRIR